jgi:agmatinase
LGTPYVTNLDDLHADFAVLGVPFDEGTWGWPGERYGPRAMRESSQEYNHDLTEGFYYIDGDRTVLKGKHWVDVGDVPVMPTVPSQTDDKITEMVRKIRSKGAFPIVLGGDHSITFPVLRAFDIPVTVIHFDAHLDTWNGAPGNLDHASWVNRAVELPNVKGDSAGARGQPTMRRRWELGNTTPDHNGMQIPERSRLVLRRFRRAETSYITLDVDVMDPRLHQAGNSRTGRPQLF